MPIGLDYNMRTNVHFILIITSLFTTTSMAVEYISHPTLPANSQKNDTTTVISPSAESLSPSVTATQGWVLNSTIISPYLRIAIINGKQVKIGEKISNAKVKSIEHQQVKLSYQSEIITLSLHRSFISELKAKK